MDVVMLSLENEASPQCHLCISVVHSAVNESVLITLYLSLLFVCIVLWFINIYLSCIYPYSTKNPSVGLEEWLSC